MRESSAPPRQGEPAPAPDEAAEERRPRRGLRIASLLSFLMALVLFGWVAYEYWGTNVVAGRAQEAATAELRREWERGPADRAEAAWPEGAAMALLRVPRFGAGFVKPVLEGVGEETLARSVGHFPGTALPGEVGNFAVAGHRVTHGQPFHRLPELRPGDRIVVETRVARFEYAVINDPRELVVQPDDGWVVEPVPGKRGARPTEALMTITTCEDLFRSSDRMVAHAKLVKRTAK